MKEKSVGIIQRAVWCRIVGFMLAMLIHLTGAEALFAQDDVSAGSDEAADAVEQANDSIPPGTWEVTQVTVDKNTDGRKQTSAFNKVVEMQDSIPFPSVWVIKESQIELNYTNGAKEIFDYRYADGQLMLIRTDIQPYQFSIYGETLTLTMLYAYTNNLPAERRTERISEKWTITLRMKKD